MNSKESIGRKKRGRDVLEILNKEERDSRMKEMVSFSKSGLGSSRLCE